MRRQLIPKNRRGALLIVAMLLAAITAISIVSYLRIGSNSMQLAHRAFFQNAAMNLAEGGLDQAMWCIDQVRQTESYETSWTGWTISGSNASNTFSEGELGLNATGSVRVLVENYKSNAPVVTARATVTPKQGMPVEKWVQVRLTKRSRFGDGLVSESFVDFNGNGVSVDSYISDTDGDHNPLTGSPAVWTEGTKRDNGSVASIQVTAGTVTVGNADVWGYVATGDPTTTAGSSKSYEVIVGNQGSILGEDSPSGVSIDTNRVASDFTYDFERISTPTGGTAMTYNKATTPVFPVKADIDAGNTTVTYRMATGALINGPLTIKQNTVVTLIFPKGSGIKLSGTDTLNIEEGGVLIIYTEDSLDITGKGLLNTNSPAHCQIYGTVPPGGTATSNMTIKIAGNGALNAAVYAPDAAIEFKGGGNSGYAAGSFVGKSIKMTGNSAFHYDESLKDLDDGRMGIAEWKELTQKAQRDAKAPLLSF